MSSPSTTKQPTPEEIAAKLDEKRKKIQKIIFRVAVILYFFVFGPIAVYLSWKCNTAADLGVITKTLFAICAFFTSIFYIFMYVIYQLNTCILLKRIPGSPSPQPMPAPPVAVPTPAAPSLEMPANLPRYGGKRK